MTFKSYLLKKGKSSTTAQINEQSLCKFLNWCEDQRIESEYATYNEIMGYVKDLQLSGIAQSTVRIHMNGLKSYFEWCIDRELREDNPVQQVKVKGIKRKHLYHILTIKELEELYVSYPVLKIEDANEGNSFWFKDSYLALKRSRVVLGLIIWQALSLGELENLTIKDVKLRDGKIFIAGARRSNERELKLEATQIMDMMEYLNEIRPELLKSSKQETERLFIPSKSQGKLGNMIHYMTVKIQKINPNVKNLKQVRASVITYWLKHYNLREVQYRAGHRYVSSTEAYQINDLEGLQEDIDKYHPF